MTTRISYVVISALLASTTFVAQETATATAPQACALRARTAEEMALLKEHLNTPVIHFPHAAVAFVGVDVLGRIAVAIDTNGDGVSEQMLLYTDQARLEGPWSKRVRDADVHISNGAVAIASRQDKFAMSFAVSDADLLQTPNWAPKPITLSAGRELVRLFGDSGEGIALSSLDYGAVHSWPEVFWDDLLGTTGGGCGAQGQCCEDRDCDAGRFPTVSCSIGGCAGVPSSCSVSGCSGTDPTVFSCCKCDATQGHKASCRCRACTCGPCD